MVLFCRPILSLSLSLSEASSLFGECLLVDFIGVMPLLLNIDCFDCMIILSPLESDCTQHHTYSLSPGALVVFAVWVSSHHGF